MGCSSRRDRPRPWPLSGDIGCGRHDVPCPGFDAHLSSARGQSEHKDGVGTMLRNQARQIAIDRRISRIKNMRDDMRSGESRPAPARETFCKQCGGINGRAGKPAEAGDEQTRRTTPIPRRRGHDRGGD